jgi:hypothetical protein
MNFYLKYTLCEIYEKNIIKHELLFRNIRMFHVYRTTFSNLPELESMSFAN